MIARIEGKKPTKNFLLHAKQFSISYFLKMQFIEINNWFLVVCREIFRLLKESIKMLLFTMDQLCGIPCSKKWPVNAIMS